MSKPEEARPTGPLEVNHHPPASAVSALPHQVRNMTAGLRAMARA